MAVRKAGLGKGLDSLIPEHSVRRKAEKTEQKPEKNELLLKITDIEPNREQPRKHFDEDALLELSDSIKQFGIIQPLIVQKKEDHYEIIAGERRWRAAKMAGLKEVPAIIKSYTDREILEISLIENIQRENLNPIDEARAYKKLLTEFHLKQDEVAERVSKSRTAVTNSMRLLKLDERVQQMVIDEMLTTGHARALISIEDRDLQFQMANQIFDNKLSVRETEKLVRKLGEEKEETTKTKEPEQHSSVRTGISMLRNRSTVFFHSFSYHILLSSGLHTTIISCFSNWWIRYTPRSSMPCAPFSFLKHGE